MPSMPTARRSDSRVEQTRRVFTAAAQAGLRVKLHAEQLSNMHGAALAAEFRALSADHLEYVDERGHRSHGPGGNRRGPVARRFLFPARDAAAAADRAARRAHSDGAGHRLQPRHLAPDLAAAWR